MTWFSRWKSSESAPAAIVANRDSVVIEIRREWLVEKSKTDEAAKQILRLLDDGEGGGDWGGRDYPKINIDPDVTLAIINVIGTAHIKSSTPAY